MTFFNEKIDRLNTASVKWEATKEIFGETDLWPMWVADMDFKPPQAVIEAIKKRADHGVFGYTFIPESTKQAIAAWVSKRHSWTIDGSWLLYCSGVVQAISTAIQAFTEEGDRVLLQSPVYTPFFEMIKQNNRTVVNSPLILEGNQYRIDFAAFEEELKKGCKLFLLCSPHNPGGRVWTKDELLQMGELCLKYNCLILSDEIHSDLVYKEYKHTPIASITETLSENVITCIAPSKTFNLAGLQASVAIIKNNTLRKQFDDTLKRQGFFTLNTFGIIAMEAAYLEGEAWLEELMAYLQDNKQYVLNFLQENLPEITCIDSEGTYLLWLDCRKLGLSDQELRASLLQKGRLALEPGTKYGLGGEGFVRMNIACPKEHVIEGLNRLKMAFK
ncbi:MalY/PatB family protein [Neobacillus mesonae]|uniref:cysteine-S-conjugate beta-lyase n=1 Tax=Neobacillus mesonae TaxID=1193713 RepID=A0A3Q9R196_9BACI|nr:PatB family C-S lyase [Neobacillus mesonae]AZU63800.1 cystathionine beta-lyase [Neobacillus mesonae]